MCQLFEFHSEFQIYLVRNIIVPKPDLAKAMAMARRACGFFLRKAESPRSVVGISKNGS